MSVKEVEERAKEKLQENKMDDFQHKGTAQDPNYQFETTNNNKLYIFFNNHFTPSQPGNLVLHKVLQGVKVREQTGKWNRGKDKC